MDEIKKDFPFFSAELPHERLEYVRALIVSDNPDKLPQLKKLFGSETDIQVKYEIRKGINELESLSLATESAEEMPDVGELRFLLRSLQHGNVRKACYYIVKNGLCEFLPELFELKLSLDVPFLNISILKLLHLGGKDNLDKIADFLQDDDPRVIATALECLENIGDQDTQLKVLEFVLHEDNRVRATAMKTLYGLGEDKGLSLLGDMAVSENSAYRDSAAFALASLNKEKTVPFLKILLSDSVESIRAKAYGGLLVLADDGSALAMDALSDAGTYGLRLTATAAQSYFAGSPALNSNVKEFRISAMALLENEKPETALRAVLQRLALENEPEVIAAGIGCLRKLPGYASLKQELLRSYLSNEADIVRVAAIEVLLDVLPEEERGFFITFLDDFCPRVVASALIGLMRGNYRSYLEYGLRRLFNNNTEDSMLMGVYCVGVLQNEKYLDFVERVLYCPYPKVRDQALELLDGWACLSQKAHDILAAYRRKLQPDFDSGFLNDSTDGFNGPWY
jgi:HEAT repeat protein